MALVRINYYWEKIKNKNIWWCNKCSCGLDGSPGRVKYRAPYCANKQINQTNRQIKATSSDCMSKCTLMYQTKYNDTNRQKCFGKIWSIWSFVKGKNHCNTQLCCKFLKASSAFVSMHSTVYTPNPVLYPLSEHITIKISKKDQMTKVYNFIYDTTHSKAMVQL